MTIQGRGTKGETADASPLKDNIEARRQLSGGGKTPLYYGLAELLIRRIEHGEYEKGDLFPGEKYLASEYGVSLITVRAAMRILIERGLVARYPGKGSFVLSQRQIHAQWGLGSVDDLVMTGLQAKFMLLKNALIIPPDWVSQKYSCLPGTKVYWFRTVRENQGERFLINDIYHPAQIGETIKKLKFSDEGVRKKLMITLVQEHCGLTLGSMYQTMSAELASVDVARILDIKRGRPILVIDRDYFSTHGDLIQVTRSRYRVDQYRYTINVTRL